MKKSLTLSLLLMLLLGLAACQQRTGAPSGGVPGGEQAPGATETEAPGAGAPSAPQGTTAQTGY